MNLVGEVADCGVPDRVSRPIVECGPEHIGRDCCDEWIEDPLLFGLRLPEDAAIAILDPDYRSRCRPTPLSREARTALCPRRADHLGRSAGDRAAPWDRGAAPRSASRPADTLDADPAP